MGDQKVDSVAIRSYPKAIFLYPTFLTAIFCTILSYAQLKDGVYSKLPGDIFFTVFVIRGFCCLACSSDTTAVSPRSDNIF